MDHLLDPRRAVRRGRLRHQGRHRFLANRSPDVRNGLGDAKVFAKQSAVDAFAATPPDQLLTGLRGKDVLFTFIESYGRGAIDDPAMAPEVDATLDAGRRRRCKTAGFASQQRLADAPP